MSDTVRSGRICKQNKVTGPSVLEFPCPSCGDFHESIGDSRNILCIGNGLVKEKWDRDPEDVLYALIIGMKTCSNAGP